MSNIYNIVSTNLENNQSSYDAYNSFIFDSNKNIFFKLATRIDLFSYIENVHGDIVECGVFKGSGMMVWLKLLNMYTPNDSRKVIGFDFFGKDFVNELKDDIDKNGMAQVFDRCNVENDELSVEFITNKFIKAGIDKNKFELIKGDVSKTTKEFALVNPGLRISLLYMDVDIEEPTYNALVNLWDRVSVGGIVVFDEYAYHVWSESNAVDRFVRDNNLVLYKLNVPAPTAYIVKEF